MLVMEKSEPILVPEWLKSNGSIGRSSNAVQNTASSILHSSDDHSATVHSRSRLTDHDSYRSSFLDRTSSSYSRRNSKCNGSMMHEKDSSGHLRSYSSSDRNNRDRYREKNLPDFREKGRSVIGGHRDRDYPDSLSSDFRTNMFEKDRLRRSQSLISGKQAELWPKREAADLNCSSNSSNNLGHHNTLGVRASIVGSNHKVTFERDFPSLGADEKPGVFDTERVSPGLNSAVQMLRTSAAIGGSGWTSALAEVPTLKESSSVGPLSVQQTAPATSATVAPIITTGLNMAETLAQAPSRVRTTPQISVETHRLEELAIKQSRQLIPKTLVLNSEKSKPKAAIRNETSATAKTGNQQLSSSHLINHSLRGGPGRSDSVKTLHGGKLLVLKAPREKNGISPASATTDLVNPTNTCKSVTNLLSITSATSARPTSPNNPKLAVAERKAYVPGTNSSLVEKKSVVSQAQSRSDFFDLMRKKTSTSISSSAADPSSVSSPTVLDHSGELITEVATAIVPQGSDSPSSGPSFLDWSTENGVKLTNDGDTHDESQVFPHNGEKHSTPIEFVYSDEKEVEKEVAFLRWLGWNETEEEAITEEEIDDFNKRYTEFRSSLKQCRDPEWQQEKLRVVMLRFHASSLDNTSSECSLSDSDSDDSDV